MGESASAWIEAQQGQIEIVDKVVKQSSDHEYHCVTICIFYKMETSLINIFTLDAIIFVICINIIFILLYKENYLKLLRNVFWYIPESEATILYNIKSR